MQITFDGTEESVQLIADEISIVAHDAVIGCAAGRIWIHGRSFEIGTAFKAASSDKIQVFPPSDVEKIDIDFKLEFAP